jgi:hypothetical protein
LIENPIVAPAEECNMYPIGDDTIADITTLSSKQIRLSNEAANDYHCVYKSGLILTPPEVTAWTRSLRKLTSVRHRSNILRIAHGDVYSNSRLFKFGLIDNPSCRNCSAATEDINHKLISCPNSLKVWREIKRLKDRLGLEMEYPVTMEEVLGTRNGDKLSLALNAEVLTKIMSYGGKRFCPNTAASTIIKTIGTFEPLGAENKTILMNWVVQI